MTAKQARKKSPAPKPSSGRKTKKATGRGGAAGGALGWLLRTAAATGAGCLVFLSFPRYDLFYLSWFALVPLLWSLEGRSPRAAMWYGFVAGLTTNLGGFHWINGLLREFGHMPPVASIPLTVLLAGYQALVFVVFARLAVTLRERTPFGWFGIAPAVFVVAELLVPFIFPWYLANGQYRFYAITQITEITGVLGLTFLVVLVNVALYELGRGLVARGVRIPWLRIGLTAGLFVGVAAYGLVRIAQVDDLASRAPTLRIGMVEADVGIWEKQARNLAPEERRPTLRKNLLKHQLLSAEAVRQGAELIVWPESSYVPVGPLWAKRTDLFALAVGRDGVVVQQRDRQWIANDRREDFPFPPQKVRGLDLTAARSVDEWHTLVVGEGGLVLDFDGHVFQVEESGVRETLYDVLPVVLPRERDIPARLRVFAVGGDGIVLRRDTNQAWRREPSLTKRTLRALAGRSPEAIYALGDGGVALGFDGQSWRQLPPAATDVTDAAVAPDGNLWVVGPGGYVGRFDGRRWLRLDVPTKVDLHAVWAGGRGQVVVAGAAGTLLVRNDRNWQRVATDTKDALRAVGVDPRGGILAVGDGGRVVRWDSGRATSARLPTERDLLGLATFGHEPFFSLPHDVAYVRPSATPLPPGADLTAVERADRKTPEADRNAIQRGFAAPILLGAVTVDDDTEDGRRRIYNTALLVDEGGVVRGRYDKVYLLMFGEYIPLEGLFSESTRRKLHEWLPEAGNFEAGTTVSTFPFRGYELGVMVCYEDIIPRFTRELAGKNPNLLINVTNDAWFGKTSEPYLHLALATFRAVENRLALVRSTNTGVSAFIDPVGRIRKETSLEGAEILMDDVPLLDTETFYRTYGDLVGYGSLAWVAVLLVWGFRRRRPT